MYTYRATVTRCIDGDTFDATVDLGFHLTAQLRFRLYGYNAPELHGEERAMGEIAKSVLMSMIFSGRAIRLRTHKGDAFGRFLADVEIESGDLVEALISGGWGVFWDGKGARPKFDPAKKYPLEA